jgi:hypothetical protein
MNKSIFCASLLLASTALITPAAAESTGCVDGVLEIDGENGSYNLKGYCETVIISGTNNRVAMGGVGTLEIAGTNHSVSAGNVKALDLAGSSNSLNAGTIGTAEIAGNNNRSVNGVVNDLKVYGGFNIVKAERIIAIEVGGNAHRIEYKYLNPNPRNPKKPSHPARQIYGSSNSVVWTKGTE